MQPIHLMLKLGHPYHSTVHHCARRQVFLLSVYSHNCHQYGPKTGGWLSFYRTTHEAVKRTLERKGADRVTSKWMCNLLSNRNAKIKVEERTIWVSTIKGCLQGRVLSPLMWSLVTNDVLKQLNEKGLNCFGYTDNIVITAKEMIESTLCDLLQNDIKIMKRWYNSVGLSINPTKINHLSKMYY